MRTVYRVTVAAVNYDDEGNFVADETLFEATHHRPEALLRFAPGEVEVVLEEVALAGVPQRAVQGLSTAPVPVPDWDRAAAPATVDGAAIVQQTETPAAAPKTRKRRTKAEIAADEAAAEAAKSTAQAVQGTPLAPLAAAVAEAMTEPAPTAAPPAAPVAAPEPVPAEAGAVPAPSGDAPPWNPFQQR